MADLRHRATAAQLATPQRPDFHHLLTLTGGTLWHAVDFAGYALEPGSWLWVRPGQVHQWGDLTGAEGTLILFRPDFLDAATADAARTQDPHAPVLRLPCPTTPRPYASPPSTSASSSRHSDTCPWTSTPQPCATYWPSLCCA